MLTWPQTNTLIPVNGIHRETKTLNNRKLSSMKNDQDRSVSILMAFFSIHINIHIDRNDSLEISGIDSV